MPIQLVTVVSQLVPSAMVVDVQTGHVAPSTMHMDPFRCTHWETSHQVQPSGTFLKYSLPWHISSPPEDILTTNAEVFVFGIWMCFLLLAAVSRRFLCWFVLVCTCYLNLGEKARIPYPFFLLAAVSRRFLCWFVLVLELVCSCLYLLFQS